MTFRQRFSRTLFVMFLAGAFAFVAAALPFSAAFAAGDPPMLAQSGIPTFEQADRNRDGLVDKTEAAAVPGLTAVLEQADRNKDGKLDKMEFGQAAALMTSGK